MWRIKPRIPHIRLRVSSPPPGVRTITIPSSPGIITVIGRSADADVVLTDGFVSRRHCELHDCEAGIMVVDTLSTHGTYVNGQRVREQALSRGDVILIGMSELLVVSLLPASDTIDKCPQGSVHAASDCD